MDAREITVKYNQLSNDNYQMKKQVEYLTQCVEKLQLLVSDLRIDVYGKKEGD